MLLNRREIEARGIVGDPEAGNFRSASYDVSVGNVYGPDGRSVRSFILPPQQMVMVVSAERLFLPEDIAGYAMPKTRLSNKGILALSTGIIDPGYEGRVSSILINFGKDPFPLDRGEAFLRLTFHPTGQIPSDLFVAPPILSEYDYQRDRRDIALGLPDTFLDIPQIETRVAGRVSATQRAFLTSVFGWGSLVLTGLALALAIIVFLGAPWVDAHFSGGIREEVARDIRTEEVQPLEERLSRLEGRLDSLENAEDTGQN